MIKLPSVSGIQNLYVFAKVTLNKDFIKKKLADMKVFSSNIIQHQKSMKIFNLQVAIEDWLKEPQTYCQVYIVTITLF